MRFLAFLGIGFSILSSFAAFGDEEACSSKPSWHTYDTKNRIETWKLTEEKQAMAVFDATGKRIEWRDWTGVTTFSYDFRGHLEEVISPEGSRTGYQHDARGNITKIKYPSGMEVAYGYRSGGVLESVAFQEKKIIYEYDMSRNLLMKRRLPNGVLTEYVYDEARRLAEIVHQDAQQNLIAHFHFEYDKMDNRILTQKKTPDQETTLEYGYDKIYRLTEVRGSEGVLEKYTYDRWGNRQTKATPEELITYTYDQQGWLKEAGNTRYEYDKNGFLKNKISPEGTSTYTYNELGQLIKYENDAATVEFAYNGRGERLHKIVNGETTYYAYEQVCSVFQVLEEEKREGTIQYIYGHGCLGYLHKGKMHYYLESDPGGSVGFILDEEGYIIEEIEYYSFGKALSASSSSFLYNAEQVDAETGLCFLRTRYYDPELGRFISPDQFPADAHNPQTLNRYVYANNNPLNCYDPMGTLPGARTNGRQPILWSKGVPIREDDGPLPPEGMTWVVLCARKGGIFVHNPYKNQIFREIDATGGHGWIEFVDSKGVCTSISVQAEQDDKGNCPCRNDAKADKYKYDQDTIRIAFLFEDGEVGDIKEAVEKFSEQKYNVFMHNCVQATGVGADAGGISSFFETLCPTYSDDGPPFSWERISIPSKLYSSIEKTINQVTGRDHPLITPPPELMNDVIWMHLATDDSGMPPSRQQIELEAKYFQSFPGVLADRGNFGGISLSKRAELKIDLQEIYGAVFDEKTQQMILVGKKGIRLPEMRLDDLAVAIQSVYGLRGIAQDPGVSIEPSSNDMEMDVHYFGATYGTAFGKTLFDADYALKMLFNGWWRCGVPGFCSFKDRWAVHAIQSDQLLSFRTWIVPEEISLMASPDGSSMVFDQVKMSCLAESKLGDHFYAVPCHEEFARHFTDHYDAIAAEYPVFGEIKRLGQITGVVKWLKDSQIPFDLSFFNAYTPQVCMTPSSIPRQEEHYSHISGTPIFVKGGIELSLAGVTCYVSGIKEMERFKEEVLSSRPSEETFAWEFKDTQRNPLCAEAFPLVKSRKTGNFTRTFIDLTYPVNGDFPLALARYYDSFCEQDHGLGIGWSLSPYSMAFSVKSLLQMGDTTIEGYRAILVREHNQEWIYEPRLLGNGGIWYFREDGRERLFVHPDQTISLFFKNGAFAQFDSSGTLQSITDRNGIWTKYHHASGRLMAIEHQDNQQIQLEYVEDRLNFAKTPHGEKLFYSYDDQRQLAAIKNGSNKLIHAYYYDPDLRLNKILNAREEILFEGDYDDYNRLFQVRTDGKQWIYDYNLAERSARMTSPEGAVTEKKFDERGDVFRENRDGQELWEKVFHQGQWEEKIFDAKGEMAWKYTLNVDGLPSEITDARGNAWQFFYDIAERVILKKDPHGDCTCYQYDEKGRLSLKVAHATDVIYDPIKKTVQAAGKREDRTRYFYHNNGRLKLLIEGEENTYFQYEQHGLLEEVILPSGYIVRRKFDEKLRVKEISDKGGVLKTFIFDDEAEKLTEVISLAGTIKHSSAEGIQQVTDKNGYTTRFEYDRGGQLSRVTDAEGSIFHYGN